MRYFITLEKTTDRVDVSEAESGELRVEIGGRMHTVLIQGDNVLVDGRVVRIALDEKQNRIELGTRSLSYEISRDDPKLRGSAATSTRPEIRSPMPGKVVEVRAAVGASVSQGDCLVVIEAMKMQNELAAPVSGTVKNVLVSVGKAVEAGALLVELSSAE